jgi:DNA polymerase-3 subunit epsilon
MQLSLDAADRLVELVEEQRGPVAADDAARRLFAMRSGPVGLARDLLASTVEADARLAWSGDRVTLAAPPGHDLLLEDATYVVVDLETTGLRPGVNAICEIGAVRVRGLELDAEFQTLVNPGTRLPRQIETLTGILDRELRRAPPPAAALRRFLAFAGDAVLVAHNARFDLSFLDREVGRLTGNRIAAPVVDTVGLARRLLAGRVARRNLATLAHFFGASVRPCHRALPDAQATAEILLALIGLAQERGARTVADLVDLAATRPRRAHGKRTLAFGAPQRPGVYLFRDRHDQVLYVGRARDLRKRLRSYFTSERQRPAVEAAVAALDRIEWHVCGSELEAALEELRLIRELRPAANARSARPDRYVYLRRRGDGICVSSKPGPLGPIRSRSRAQQASRALRDAHEEELAGLVRGAPLPRLRRKLASLADAQRYEDAARLRDRVDALEGVVRELQRLERLRATTCCVLAPSLEEGWTRAWFVAAGRVAAARHLPPGGGAVLEIESGLAAARRAVADGPSLEPEAADELLLLASFLRRPPPELRVTPLDRDAILRGRMLPRA